MHELIKITEQNGQRAVNARELHSFLEVQSKFAEWINRRISDYGFIEGQDFVSFSENSEKPNSGRPSKEYAISLDMAKELSMVERNEKGKLARLYFIEMEKRAQGMLLDYQVPLELGSSEKSIREQAKDKQRELMSVIRRYLKHGDITDVANKLNKRYDVIKDILNCHYHNKEITQALYQRALDNKRNMLIDYDTMINELKK